jgi:hypothetical protein
MDNEFADLELELKRLRPRRPSARLEAGIDAALNASEPMAMTAAGAERRADRVAHRGGRVRGNGARYTTATNWTSGKWSNWSIAAALVALIVVFTDRTGRLAQDGELAALQPRISVNAAEHAEPTMRPVRAERTLLGSQVDGIIELADGSPVQRVRDYFVDTIVWRDPSGQSELTWQVPQEAVRFVGLATY